MTRATVDGNRMVTVWELFVRIQRRCAKPASAEYRNVAVSHWLLVNVDLLGRAAFRSLRVGCQIGEKRKPVEYIENPVRTCVGGVAARNKDGLAVLQSVMDFGSDVAISKPGNAEIEGKEWQKALGIFIPVRLRHPNSPSPPTYVSLKSPITHYIS